MTTPRTRTNEKAARKRADLARTWRYDQQYEDALKVRETDPARFAALSADHRSAVEGYYLPAREAAEAAGVDVSKEGSR